jgi:hypothetical protein
MSLINLFFKEGSFKVPALHLLSLSLYTIPHAWFSMGHWLFEETRVAMVRNITY